MVPLRDHIPTRTFPFVNYGLIAVNVAVFGLELLLWSKGADVAEWALVPARLVSDPRAAAPKASAEYDPWESWRRIAV